jgi:hypothetical protein
MPFAETEHPIDDLGPDGEHEPFRKSVRARAARRDPHGLDTGIGQDRVKRPGELSAWADQSRWCRYGVMA